MTADQIAAFCLQLPGAREDLKWGSNRVFSVAGNKMFAILDFVDKDGGLAFKVGSELFLGYVKVYNLSVFVLYEVCDSRGVSYNGVVVSVDRGL